MTSKTKKAAMRRLVENTGYSFSVVIDGAWIVVPCKMPSAEFMAKLDS